MKKLFIRQVAVNPADNSEQRWEVQMKKEDGTFIGIADENMKLLSFSTREEAIKAREVLMQTEEIKFHYDIETHRRYQEDDYKHLKAKGYNDSEIANIWNNDIKHDIVSNLLWLRANNPEVAEEVLADFVNLKNNNPYQSNPNNNA